MEPAVPADHNSPKKPPLYWRVFQVFLVISFVAGVGYYFWYSSQNKVGPAQPGPEPDKTVITAPETGAVTAFADAADFQEWLEKAGVTEVGYGTMRRNVMVEAVAAPTMGMDLGLDSATAIGLGAGEKAFDGEPERYSETNVQVAGIDEPDIVKTDGKEIYYSPERRYYWGVRRPMMLPEVESDAVPEAISSDPAIIPPKPEPRPLPEGVRAIRAWPPSDLKIDAAIDKFGTLLLSGETLLVQSNEALYGYDVTDPAKPAEKWKLSLENDHQIVTSRLYQDKVYLVARASINDSRPCPIVPLKHGDLEISIPCGGVYHPIRPTPSDVTYSIMKIDAASGQVEQSTSFVGSWNSSAVYMSEKYLYVTHAYNGDVIGFIVGFLRSNSDLAPAGTVARLEKLQGYDISDNAKMVELQVILEQWNASLSQDDRLKLENDMVNRMDIYFQEHLRELQQTGIVRVMLDGLTVSGSGAVPGHLLNQFSLDEYQGYLRLATTVGGRGTPLAWQFGIGNDDSVNDVYTLDPDLSVAGAVKDLGKGERIYSVRFLQDKGYVVTFKETDPLYVIDLADARDPRVRGELKIPGYSSYLHPITKDKILGIGKEGSQVKVSLFDVSDPTSPAERSKYTLEEYWTDVMNTHHAFLLDTTHEIFFMPGSKGGYIFGYAGDELKLVRAVSGIRAKRAVYISDYLYVLGEDKIVVLNEKDWTEVNHLDVPAGGYYPTDY